MQHSSKEDSSLDYAQRFQSAASSERRIEIFDEVTATIAAGDSQACRAIILQARLSFSNPSKPVEEQRAALRAYAAALKRSPESESVLPEDLNTLLSIEVHASGDEKDEARRALVAVSKAAPSMVEECYDQKRLELENGSNLENKEQLEREIGILNEILPEFAFRDAAHETTEKPPAKSLGALGTLGSLLSACPQQKTPQFLQNIGHMTQNGLSKVTQGRPLGVIPLLANVALPVAVAADLATVFPRIVASDMKRSYLGADSVLGGVTSAAAVGALHSGISYGIAQQTKHKITAQADKSNSLILNSDRPNHEVYISIPPQVVQVGLGASFGFASVVLLSCIISGLLELRYQSKLGDRDFNPFPAMDKVLNFGKSWQGKNNKPEI